MINVVIADDDAMVRKGLMKLIPWEALGAQVVFAAADGSEAIEALSKHKVDLIVSDIKMPCMDGIELARYLKDYNYNINIILLSAYAEFEYAQEAIKYGIRDYILKPIDGEKIRQLSSLVGAIAKQHEHQAEFSEHMHDENFVRRVEQYLQCGDFVSIRKLIWQINEHTHTPFIIVQEYCLILLNVLAEFIDNNGISYTSKQVLLQEFMNLKATDELVRFVEYQYDSACSFKKNIKNNSDHIVNNAKKIIENQYYDSNLNANIIANQLNLSLTYLGTVFKSQEDCTLTQYLTTIRMTKARELLRNSRVSIQQAAKKTGYNDIKYFNRVFKKMHGLSPSEYRSKSEGGGAL